MQLFGTVETPQGLADATLLIDDDRPLEYMIQWYGVDITAGGILAAATQTGNVVDLAPQLLYRVGDKGGLFPPQLTKDEIDQLTATKAQLRRIGGGFEGEWTGPNTARGAISFPELTGAPPLIRATRCRTWAGFKTWAATCRQENGAAWFRGHGSNTYSLRTSLHRAGRYRLQRFFSAELLQFKSHAEALFNRRFNIANDADDYSTVIALAQHHGLPTPLLDWTESPYIAAFFAFSDALDATRSGIKSNYVRVYALSEKMIKIASPSQVILGRPSPFVSTLTVAPLHNPRLQAQQGRFMVTNVANVEAFILDVESRIGERHLFAIDIPTALAAEALQDLAFMGLTAATMFPGLDGVTRMIRHEMFYKKSP